MAAENIEFLPYYEVKEIAGDGMVQKVILTQNQTGEEKEIELSGIFIAVGMEPQTAFVKDVVERNDAGYICAGGGLPDECAGNLCGRRCENQTASSGYYSGFRWCRGNCFFGAG